MAAFLFFLRQLLDVVLQGLALHAPLLRQALDLAAHLLDAGQVLLVLQLQLRLLGLQGLDLRAEFVLFRVVRVLVGLCVLALPHCLLFQTRLLRQEFAIFLAQELQLTLQLLDRRFSGCR